MKLKDIMTPIVEVVHPDTALQDCARKMKANDIGSIPVCDGDRLVGMVTDRDLVIRAFAEGLSPNDIAVREVMSSPIVFAFEDEDVASAARIMEVKQIRRLAVLNHKRRLVGIVSLGDVAAKTGNEALSGEILQKICEPLFQNPTSREKPSSPMAEADSA